MKDAKRLVLLAPNANGEREHGVIVGDDAMNATDVLPLLIGTTRTPILIITKTHGFNEL
jgi:hypothetical protein